MAYQPWARIDMRERHLCGVCSGLSDVRGAARRNRHVFFCDECGLGRAKEIGDMSSADLRQLQKDALADASPRIGAFLDTRLRKTDLAAMTEPEWLAFLAQVVAEYGVSMRKLTGAPF